MRLASLDHGVPAAVQFVRIGGMAKLNVANVSIWARRETAMARDSASGKRNRNQCEIGIYSSMALIDPPVPILTPYLEYTAKRFEQGGDLGYQEREEPVAVWDFDIKGRMGILAGLVPRVIRVLEDRGYEVKLSDHRKYGKRFTVNRKFFESTAGEDRRLLNIVRQEPLGQIEVRNRRDMLDKVTKIIFLYPKARVLLPVGSRAEAQRLRRLFFNVEMDRGVYVYQGSWPDKHCRCLICHIAALQSERMNEKDWDIVMLPDPQGAVGNVGAYMLGRFHGDYEKEVHRVYSFVQPGMRLERRARIRLEAFTGRVIYRLEQERADVGVLWLPTPDCARLDKELTGLAFRRKAYWHNANRNDYIAAVAKALVSEDARKLADCGFGFLDGEPVIRHWPRLRVAVMVASTEQAREMAKRLPGWETLDAVPSAGDKATRSGDRMLFQATGMIITEAKAGKHGLDADVVIRAGGGTGRLCFKDFPPVMDVEDQRDALVVDLRDEFDVRAGRDAKRRSREYELLGWEYALQRHER